MGSSSPILRLRGLPFSCTAEDVEQFFEGFGVAALHLCHKNGGAGRRRGPQLRRGGGPGAPRAPVGPAGAVGAPRRPASSPLRALMSSPAGKRSGEGYVEFESPEEAARALKEKQHAHLGSRYIE